MSDNNTPEVSEDEMKARNLGIRWLKIIEKNDIIPESVQDIIDAKAEPAIITRDILQVFDLEKEEWVDVPIATLNRV